MDNGEQNVLLLTYMDERYNILYLIYKLLCRVGSGGGGGGGGLWGLKSPPSN